MVDDDDDDCVCECVGEEDDGSCCVVPLRADDGIDGDAGDGEDGDGRTRLALGGLKDDDEDDDEAPRLGERRFDVEDVDRADKGACIVDDDDDDDEVVGARSPGS